MAIPAAVYRPRHPQAIDYYCCIEDHLGNSIKVYEERFERAYGFIGYIRFPLLRDRYQVPPRCNML